MTKFSEIRVLRVLECVTVCVCVSRGLELSVTGCTRFLAGICVRFAAEGNEKCQQRQVEGGVEIDRRSALAPASHAKLVN